MNATGANAIASVAIVGVVGRIQVISRNRSGSSSHSGGCCPWSSQRCSTVAARSASHRVLVLGGLWFSTCCCSSRPSDRKFRGQVVQDRPCEVSVGPPGAYRVGVVAECDPGWLARVSCRVHRSLVRFRRLQPTVRLRRRSTSGEPVPGLRVWGFARSSRHIGEPGRTMSRIMSGKVPSEVRGNRAAVARGGRGTTMSPSTRASPK